MGFYYSTWAIWMMLLYATFRAFPEQPPTTTPPALPATHRPRKTATSQLRYQELKLKLMKRNHLKRNKRSSFNSQENDLFISPPNAEVWYPTEADVGVLITLSDSKRYKNYMESNNLQHTHNYIDTLTTKPGKIHRDNKPVWNYLTGVYQPYFVHKTFLESELKKDNIFQRYLRPKLKKFKREAKNLSSSVLDKIIISSNTESPNITKHERPHEENDTTDEIGMLELRLQPHAENLVNKQALLNIKEKLSNTNVKNETINNGSKRSIFNEIIPRRDQKTLDETIFLYQFEENDPLLEDIVWEYRDDTNDKNLPSTRTNQKTTESTTKDEEKKQYSTTTDEEKTQYGTTTDEEKTQYGAPTDEEKTQYGATTDEEKTQYGTTKDEVKTQYRTTKYEEKIKYSPTTDEEKTQYGTTTDEEKIQYGTTKYEEKTEYRTTTDEEKTQYGNTIYEEKTQYGTTKDEGKPQYGTTTDQEKTQYSTATDEERTQYGTTTDEEKTQYGATTDKEKTHHNNTCLLIRIGKAITESRKKLITKPSERMPITEKMPIQKVLKKVSKVRPKTLKMFSKTKSKLDIIFRNQTKLHKLEIDPIKSDFQKYDKLKQSSSRIKAGIADNKMSFFRFFRNVKDHDRLNLRKKASYRFYL